MHYFIVVLLQLQRLVEVLVLVVQAVRWLERLLFLAGRLLWTVQLFLGAKTVNFFLELEKLLSDRVVLLDHWHCALIDWISIRQGVIRVLS